MMKNAKYAQLSLDLEEQGFQVFLMPFEVTSSGHIAKPCKSNCISTLRQFNIKLKANVFVNFAKIALLCTMSVFHAYQVQEWVSLPSWPLPPFLDLSTVWTKLLGVDCPAVRHLSTVWTKLLGVDCPAVRRQRFTRASLIYSVDYSSLSYLPFVCLK